MCEYAEDIRSSEVEQMWWILCLINIQQRQFLNIFMLNTVKNTQNNQERIKTKRNTKMDCSAKELK